jgi:hypothetical protein
MHSMVGYLLQISIYLFFSKFKTNLLAENHSIIRARTRFAVVQDSVRLLLGIITLVSSANNMGSAREFIRNERSFIYTKNSKGPKMDTWGPPCFNMPQSETKL